MHLHLDRVQCEFFTSRGVSATRFQPHKRSLYKKKIIRFDPRVDVLERGSAFFQFASRIFNSITNDYYYYRRLFISPPCYYIFSSYFLTSRLRIPLSPLSPLDPLMANATSDRKKMEEKKDQTNRFVTLLLIIKDTNPANFFFPLFPPSKKIGDS